MADMGHPIVGDPTYGGRALQRIQTGCEAESQAIRAVLHRPFLHAEKLGFTHPATGEFMLFTAPLPPELVTALEVLA